MFGGLAAVDCEGVAGDEAGEVGERVEDGGRNVVAYCWDCG